MGFFLRGTAARRPESVCFLTLCSIIPAILGITLGIPTLRSKRPTSLPPIAQIKAFNALEQHYSLRPWSHTAVLFCALSYTKNMCIKNIVCLKGIDLHLSDAELAAR
ncbi:hypothetical protein HDV63DRAFT_387479 [Trichoderma sp. SZMC 28014]